VCSGLLFFILLGMALSYFFAKGTSLWFIDLNSKGQMTPISVGVEAFELMPKADEPLFFFGSRKGDRVLPVWNFQRGKPLRPACTMLRDQWMALYDIRHVDWLGKKVEQMMARENRMFTSEQMFKEEAILEFAPLFVDWLEELRRPGIAQVKLKRQYQSDVGEVKNILRNEDLAGVRHQGGGGGE